MISLRLSAPAAIESRSASGKSSGKALQTGGDCIRQVLVYLSQRHICRSFRQPCFFGILLKMPRLDSVDLVVVFASNRHCEFHVLALQRFVIHEMLYRHHIVEWCELKTGPGCRNTLKFLAWPSIAPSNQNAICAFMKMSWS